MRFAQRCFVAFLALCLASCAASSGSGSNEARSAVLAKQEALSAFGERCSLDAPPNAEPPADAPEPPATPRPEPGPFMPGVFLDTALFLLPTARAETRVPASLESLINDAEVRLLGTPHLSVTFGATASMVLQEHTGPLAEATLGELHATAKPTTGTELALELDALLLLPTAQTAIGKPPEGRVHFVMAPAPGQTIASTAQIPERAAQSLLLLLTPYEIRREADLRALFLCKMAQRKRALAR